MKKWLLRILLGIGILTITSSLVTYFVIDDTITAMYGADTPLAAADFNPSPDRFVVVNAAVLSPAADAFIANQAVRIENGVITAVGAIDEIPAGFEVIDGSGQYLVPGYTDSHVHLWNSPNDLLLYLANGVTQVREMHGVPRHLAWKREIEAGRAGPDLFVVAAQIATYGFWEGLWIEWSSKRNVVRSPQATQRTIHELQQQGFDAIKASSFLSAENHVAASHSTREQKIPFVGHLPIAVDLDELWSSNQKELAHIEELVKGLNRQFGRYNADTAQDFLDHVRSRRDAVARRAAEAGITVVTTLAISESFGPQIIDLHSALHEAEFGYVNPGIAEGQAMGWLPGVHRYGGGDPSRSDEWRDRQTRYWNAYAEAHRLMLDALIRHQVPLLTGTDANVPVMVPGFSMHQEMQSLVDAGMSPAQVLAAATVAAGEWMNWKTGQIRAGFKANLVLLRENPLADIGATASIDRVIANGRIYSRADLDAMLKTVDAANDANRSVAIDRFEH
ncbi:MAG: amidohydrolase family protein [Wenzhouxiangellaceae bacterium]